MTRLLLIPVAGTIAALVAIALAREPREQRPATPELPPFDFPDAPEHAGPDEEEAEPLMPPDESPEAEPGKPPAPEPREFQLQLEADGSIVDLESRATYESIDKLAQAIGGARHMLVVAAGKGVTNDALDKAEARLRDRFSVRKVYGAAEAPAGEGR